MGMWEENAALLDTLIKEATEVASKVRALPRSARSAKAFHKFMMDWNIHGYADSQRQMVQKPMRKKAPKQVGDK